MEQRLIRFLVAAFLLVGISTSHAANFPYIRLNGKTNIVSDNGTNLTYNNAPLSGGAPTFQQVTNALAAPNDTNQFLNGAGGWGTVAGGSSLFESYDTDIDGWGYTNYVRTIDHRSDLITHSAIHFQSDDFATGDGNYFSIITGSLSPSDTTNGGVYFWTMSLDPQSTQPFPTGTGGIEQHVAINQNVTNMPGNFAYYQFIGAHGAGGSASSNEVVLGVCSDAFQPWMISVVSASDNASIGNGSVGKIGINTNIPSAWLQVVAPDNSMPAQMWSHIDGTTVAKLAYDGSISAGSTNGWKLGAVKTCTGLTMIVTNYIEVVINGTTNAIPLGTITP